MNVVHIPVGATLKNLQKIVSDNSPSILTAIGVAGTVSTAILAGKASFQAADVIRDDVLEKKEEAYAAGEQRYFRTHKENVELVWKLYIPPVATGALTVACIIGANRISSKRATALISAYSITETAFKEYKDKVVEQIGVKKEQAVRDEIAQDRVTADPVGSREVIITTGGEVLCYETQTARYFKSDVETIRKAQNDINSQILNEGYASLNDFFSLIGLAPSGHGEAVGWTADDMLEIHFSTVLSDDNKPCISVGYRSMPVRNYWRYN